jgi:hypothetical protein
MPPIKALTGSGAGGVDRLKAQLKDEWQNDAKFSANLRLLRAIAVFASGIIVARNFGEALFAQ